MFPFFKKILVQGRCEHKKGVGGFGMGEIGGGGGGGINGFSSTFFTFLIMFDLQLNAVSNT